MAEWRSEAKPSSSLWLRLLKLAQKAVQLRYAAWYRARGIFDRNRVSTTLRRIAF